MKKQSALRVVNLGVVSYLDSQSIYHAVAACMDENTPDTIILCRPKSPYFCIGYHQNSLQALDQVAWKQLGYPVMRRRLGGGVTYLDSQQLFYQCVFHRSRSPAIPAQVYQVRLEAPIRVLRSLGLQAELLYTNEIEIGGKRIAGIGGGMIGEASVVVGNILNDFDYFAMAQIINVPCREFRELASYAMRKRITHLKLEECSSSWSELPELLISAYEEVSGRATYSGDLTSRERSEASRLAELMTSRRYLEQFGTPGSSSSLPLPRLKVSGSTSVRLVQVKENHHSKFVALMVTDGVIVEMSSVEELNDKTLGQEYQSSLQIYDSADVIVGQRIDG